MLIISRSVLVRIMLSANLGAMNGSMSLVVPHETGILQYMKDNAIDFRILEEPLLVTGLGIAFAKNDTRGLDSQLTDTLAQMRADGTLERIIGRYLENASQYLEVDTIGA